MIAERVIASLEVAAKSFSQTLLAVAGFFEMTQSNLAVS
jgi:hypothetical protein